MKSNTGVATGRCCDEVIVLQHQQRQNQKQKQHQPSRREEDIVVPIARMFTKSLPSSSLVGSVVMIVSFLIVFVIMESANNHVPLVSGFSPVAYTTSSSLSSLSQQQHQSLLTMMLTKTKRICNVSCNKNIHTKRNINLSLKQHQQHQHQQHQHQHQQQQHLPDNYVRLHSAMQGTPTSSSSLFSSSSSSSSSPVSATATASATPALTRKTRLLLLSSVARFFTVLSMLSTSIRQIKFRPMVIRRLYVSCVLCLFLLLSSGIQSTQQLSTLQFFTPPRANAVTATATATPAAKKAASSISTTRDIDKMIDRYVERYMFDDDSVYDPIESLYKEIYYDSATGKHPTAVQEIIQSVLGSDSIPTPKSITTGSGNSGGKKIFAGPSAGTAKGSSSGNVIGITLARWIRYLQVQVGLSEQFSLIIMATALVVAGPSIFLFMGMIIGGISKRNIRSVMKKRYGDTYTVDATYRPEEDEEEDDYDKNKSSNDDEDDDDDDDEDDDDDDDDEEEEKEEKKKSPKKK